jgi:hypothetical protein
MNPSPWPDRARPGARSGPMPSGTEAELVPLRIAKHQIAIAGRDVRRERARRPAGSGCRSGCWPTTSAHGSGIRCRRAAELLLFTIPVQDGRRCAARVGRDCPGSPRARSRARDRLPRRSAGLAYSSGLTRRRAIDENVSESPAGEPGRSPEPGIHTTGSTAVRRSHRSGRPLLPRDCSHRVVTTGHR